MTQYQYGALVMARFSLCEPYQNYGWPREQYILANGGIRNKRVAGVEVSNLEVKKFIIQPTSEIISMIKEHQETKLSYEAAVNKSGLRSKMRKKKMRLEDSISESFNLLILDLCKRKSLEHVAFLAENHELDVMQFINIAGKSGWETTGQVPGLPGPTGITMMRKKIN